MSRRVPAPRMTMEQILGHISDCGLKKYEAGILNALVPSVRAVVVDGDAYAIGESRLGGCPDVPADFAWPDWKGAPLAFVGQLRLEEVAPVEFWGYLPRAGVLSFFYEGGMTAWNTKEESPGAAVVFFSPPEAILHRVAAPPNLPKECRYSPCRLAFGAEFTLPYEVPGVSQAEARSPSLLEAYDLLQERLAGPNGGRNVVHRIGGHMDPIQDNLLVYPDMLLFQVDSEDAAGMMWGDVGRLYWIIDKHELAHRRFESAWLEMQCS